jgi:molecular chaperone GrpE
MSGHPNLHDKNGMSETVAAEEPGTNGPAAAAEPERPPSEPQTPPAEARIAELESQVADLTDRLLRAHAEMDNMRKRAEREKALKSLVEGVTMSEREFLNVLERHGVRRIDPAGEVFNPHLHQAVMEQANADLPSGTVLRVLQAGYVIEDRVLRPAMVVVAKGGPKPAKPVDLRATTANDDPLASPSGPQSEQPSSSAAPDDGLQQG